MGDVGDAIGDVFNDVTGDWGGTVTGALLGGPIGAVVGMGFDSAATEEEAIKKAYEEQKKGEDRALALQKYMFDLQREDLRPGREISTRLLPQQATSYERGLGLLGDMEGMARDYTASPLYQLQLGEGTKALDRVAAARGLYNSGAAMENQRRFIQNLNAVEAEKKWGRMGDILNMRMGSSPMGTASGMVNQGVGAAGQYGANAGNLYMQGGQNAANQQIGLGQARTGLYQGLQQLPFQLGSLAMMGYGMGGFGGGGGMGGGGGSGMSFMPNVNRFSLGGY